MSQLDYHFTHNLIILGPDLELLKELLQCEIDNLKGLLQDVIAEKEELNKTCAWLDEHKESMPIAAYEFLKNKTMTNLAILNEKCEVMTHILEVDTCIP